MVNDVPNRSVRNGKHVVFDLDHTLIYTPDQQDWYINLYNNHNESEIKSLNLGFGKITIPNSSRSNKYKGVSGTVDLYYIIRPYCLELLVQCFRNFETVSVWSAGSREYVKEIVDDLFSKIGKYPSIVWTRDELVNGIKPLSKMIDVFGPKVGMSLKNTILVDDMSYNFEKNPDNGLLIPHYEPRTTFDALKIPEDNLKALNEYFHSARFLYEEDIRNLRDDCYFIFDEITKYS